MTRLALAIVLLIPAAVAAQEPICPAAGPAGGRVRPPATPARSARFTRSGPDQYRVVFSGRFFGVVPFRYAQTLPVTGRQADAVELAGASRLPGFGTFEYRAAATDRAFQAGFRSRRDGGTFSLHR